MSRLCQRIEESRRQAMSPFICRLCVLLAFRKLHEGYLFPKLANRFASFPRKTAL